MKRFRLRGMTLIEVLVVIAIIMVLTGIVYASTGPAREKSRQSVCISHLRQIGQALAMYEQDYGGNGEADWPSGVGLPPSLITLAGQAVGGQNAYLNGGEGLLHCTDVTTEDLNAHLIDTGKPWTLYGYNIWKPDSVVKGRIPDFPSIFAERGSEFPIVYDDLHNRLNPGVPSQFRLILLLRMDGRVSSRQVGRRGGSWEW